MMTTPGTLDVTVRQPDAMWVEIDWQDAGGTPITPPLTLVAALLKLDGTIVPLVVEVDQSAKKVHVRHADLSDHIGQHRWEMRDTAADRTLWVFKLVVAPR